MSKTNLSLRRKHPNQYGTSASMGKLEKGYGSRFVIMVIMCVKCMYMSMTMCVKSMYMTMIMC